jgi:hypothetical protein
MALIPATFMTGVCTAYLLQAPEGFRLNAQFSNGFGVVVAVILFLLFMKNKSKIQSNEKVTSVA